MKFCCLTNTIFESIEMSTLFSIFLLYASANGAVHMNFQIISSLNLLQTQFCDSLRTYKAVPEISIKAQKLLTGVIAC